MDAAHFRAKAKAAREMARGGDDARLAQMLLDLAADLDAEADAIDAAVGQSALSSHLAA
ncbi:MAG TPA: hypothetical protein VHB27_09500 [Rhodopila sp.]|uniref:hypothetical protein n=1 Tax=Rhodopila sp. TaxID=2480087 RepID=UPI002CE79DCA|nr:hypothetical protein [Rhodopila sp.]HVY15453.1 hypothetical protein [Rhodopila sp.]